MGTGRVGAKRVQMYGLRDLTGELDVSKFRVFTDRASSGFTYNGDGQDVVDFFNNTTNYSDLIQQMSQTDIEAFQDWARGGFMYGQQYSGFSHMTSDDQSSTRIYDNWLDQSTNSEGFRVVRLAGFELINNGMNSTPSNEYMKKLKGQLIKSTGNQSTAAASEGLSIGNFNKKVSYVYYIPANSTGAGMWIGDHRINAWGPQQREFILNRDTVFRCVGVKRVSSGNYEVHLLYMGRTAHDYS